MISFKKATTNDIELIRELAEKSWESAYSEILSHEQIEYMLSTMYSEKEISTQMKNPDYQYFLIFDESILVGFIGFQFHYEESTTKLHRLYLLSEYKGKGIGKKAMNLLKEKVAETSDSRIILNVNKNNPAKKIYESQGFTIYDEGIFDIGNGFVMDDFLMEIKI